MTPPRQRLGSTAAVAGAITLALLAGSALAIPVRGTVQVPRDFADPPATRENKPYLYYWEEWNGFLDVRPKRVDPAREITVVLLSDAPGNPAAEARLDGGQFSPTTIVARVGATLRISNLDACGHELFAEGREDFGPLQTAPGNARTVALPAAGSFEIQDRLYEHVRAWVQVVPNLFAVGAVEPSGAFNFGEVPAGTYTLAAFFRGRQVHTQEVALTDQRELVIEPIALNLNPAARR